MDMLLYVCELVRLFLCAIMCAYIIAFNAVVALPKIAAIRVWSEVYTQSIGSQEMLASLIHSFVLVSRGPQPTCYWKFHKQVRRGTFVYVLVCLSVCTFVKSTGNPQKAKRSDQFNLLRVEGRIKEEQVSSLQLQEIFCMFKPSIEYPMVPFHYLWT